jgi:hypothetical protein
MKFTIFSAETYPQEEVGDGISTTAKITFSKVGKVQISKPAMDQMGLKKTDKLSLAQDEEGYWHLFKDEAGFALEESKIGALFFIHPELVAEFLKSHDKEPDQGYKAFLAEEAVAHRKKEYWRMELSQEEMLEE